MSNVKLFPIFISLAKQISGAAPVLYFKKGHKERAKWL